LKDASATAIYGSRGSNGVVIITTRRGNSGKPKIEVSAYTGIQQLSKKVDVLNADEYVELAIEATQNAWGDRGGRASDPNSARPALCQIAPYFLTPDKYKVEGHTTIVTTMWKTLCRKLLFMHTKI
jgi:TonB-dependent SusC/RagA subfamily outer membrane receptor